ncbi:MAG: glycoside hydrolase family 1 protein [Candidatus Andersenbacteria bacterium]
MGDFLWGAATSAHQVEGNNIHNDWWEWEQRRPIEFRSGRAADHYNRYKEDFALAKSLGHNAHRISLEWSRIEPAKGQWSRKAIDHYRDVLREMQYNGLKSFVTLHHFTSPQWFARRGGWVQREAADHFEQYVRFVSQQLGELVDYWVTINEPMVYATESYWRKRWPPQVQSLSQMLRVIGTMAEAHRRAYRVLHQTTPRAQVGFAKHLIAYLPEHIGQLDDQLVARLEDWWFNRRFVDLVGDTFDFVGVNYYFTTKHRVKLFPLTLKKVPWDGPVTDMGWPIRPEGLTHVLLNMRRYNKPIYITENGLADADDSRRADFIRDHLRAVERAQIQGADVRGYLHWSLLDNFEWDSGTAPRFGLVEVDYETLERRPRPSAYAYREIIKAASKAL